MFATDSITVHLRPAPVYAAVLVALHAAAAGAVALAGLPWWVVVPVGAGITARGVRVAWRDALRRGRASVERVEVRADGSAHLWLRDGREVGARYGPDTWITARFVMLDLRGSLAGVPRGLLVTAADAAALRRLSVLLRWGCDTPDEAPAPPAGTLRSP